MSDGEGFFQRVERRTVDDVFYAGDVLGTLDGGEVYNDCGLMLFDLKKQDVHCGGSGCGCSAAVLTGTLLPGLRNGTYRNILFCGTGALHSPVALGQGESVPGICHAVAISNTRG